LFCVDSNFLSNNYVSGNEYACSSATRNNINPVFCSINEEECNIPNNTGYTYCVSSDEETHMSIGTGEVSFLFFFFFIREDG
jgi:hypothetical protein